MSQQKSSKVYGTEPRCNDIPDVTMRIQRIERKIYPNITILLIHSQKLRKTLNLTQ